MKKLTLKEGLARGFHPTYDVQAQGKWKWTGDGWVNDGHEWGDSCDVCKNCGITVLEAVDREIYQCDKNNEELLQTLSRALKHHGY